MEVQMSNLAYDVASSGTFGIQFQYKSDFKIFPFVEYHIGGPFGFGSWMNNTEWSQSMAAAGAGLDYKIIEFKVAYSPNDRISDSKNSTTYTGSALHSILSFLIVKGARINLEFINHSLDSGSNSFNQYGYNKSEAESIFSLSFPFQI